MFLLPNILITGVNNKDNLANIAGIVIKRGSNGSFVMNAA
jgi:hypothetical protein